MKMTNHPPTVGFVIPTKNLQTVIKLLLSNRIEFTLISSNYPEPTPKVIAANSNRVSLKLLSPKEIKFAVIYQKYIERDIEQVLPMPTEAQIAGEFGMTLPVFKNGFKTVYGRPFYQLYLEKKMEYAKILLLQGIRAAEVSERIGYSQPIKFSKMFQKYFGMTPKQYQSICVNETVV